MSGPIYESAGEILNRIRQREVTVRDVVESHLSRIDEVNPALNAVITRCDDSALEQADKADKALSEGKAAGPLHGLPFTIKDVFFTKGIRTTAGTKGLSDHVPDYNATVVDRLLDAGAILLGKTNTPELTFFYETDNLIFGKTNNPYDLTLSPGGSSGGAAAIITAGGSPLDIGSDTGGSIRAPAHFCGIAGIKPTHGRVPRKGFIPPGGTPVDPITQIGPLCRYVGDLELILPVISGADWHDSSAYDLPPPDSGGADLRRLRVCYYTDNGVAPVREEISAAVRNAAQILGDEGASVSEDRPEGVERAADLFFRLFMTDGGAWVRRLFERYGTDEIYPFLAWTEKRDDEPEAPASAFTMLLEEIDSFRTDMANFIGAYDAIIAPVYPAAALPHGNPTNSENMPGFSYCQAYNLTGWPVVVVRGGASPEGLPIGVQIITRPWREDLGLAIARTIESRTGGFQPPSL